MKCNIPSIKMQFRRSCLNCKVSLLKSMLHMLYTCMYAENCIYVHVGKREIRVLLCIFRCFLIRLFHPVSFRPDKSSLNQYLGADCSILHLDLAWLNGSCSSRNMILVLELKAESLTHVCFVPDYSTKFWDHIAVVFHKTRPFYHEVGIKLTLLNVQAIDRQYQWAH